MAELLHSIPLTQTSEQSPHIFVDAAGSPLSVHLDVDSEIHARPRLTRLLRASGADICHSISAATILLVNPETVSGRKIVHEWTADPHKTILDYAWIQACIRSGRALLESEDWGGFHVLHTNDFIYSDDEGDEDLEDTHSGPRSKASVHPTRPKPPSHSRPSEQGVKPNMSTRAHRQPVSSNRGASNTIPAHSHSSNSSSSVITPSPPKPAAGISTQHTPIRRHSTPTSHQHTFPNFPSSQQGSAPSFPQMPNTPAMTPFRSQTAGPSTSQNLPSTTSYAGLQHSPPAGADLLHALNYAFQIQNTASQVQSAASQTLTQLVETVIAVAQGQGMDTAIIQNYLATLPMSSSVTQQSALSNVHEPVLHSVEPHLESPVSDPPIKDRNTSSASAHTSRNVVPPEPSLPAKRRRKSLESHFPAKRITSNSRQDPSGASLQPPQSGGGVFSMKNGRPIMVFVQIDTRGRHEIVHLIKKNGGKITADIPKAAFVILNPRSVTYNDLRQEADDSRRTIVQPSFVTESIKQGYLLDPNDFLLGETSSPRKLHQSGRRQPSFRDRHSPESDHATSEAPTSDTIVDASSSMLARERTITPEPPPAVQSKSGYRFTPAEMTYAWALVRRILTKDPLANKLTVVRVLQKKMPHHTEASWASTISKQKDMYEAVRTDALGLGPVAEVQQQRSPYHTQDDIRDAEMNETGRDTEELEELQVGASLILAEGDVVSNDEQAPSLEGGNKDTDERDAYARDFEALVGFLTSADADCGREDEIFDRLTAKSICLTAPSWSVFLELHAEAVTEEVERRYTTQQTT